MASKPPQHARIQEIDVIVSLDTAYIKDYKQTDSLSLSDYVCKIPQRISCKSDERILMKVMKFSGVRQERPILYEHNMSTGVNFSQVLLSIKRINENQNHHNVTIQWTYDDLYDVCSGSMLVARLNAKLKLFSDVDVKFEYDFEGNFLTFSSAGVDFLMSFEFNIANNPGLHNLLGFSQNNFTYNAAALNGRNNMLSSMLQFGISSTILVRWTGNSIEGRKLISPYVNNDDVIYVCSAPQNYSNSIDIADVEDTTPYIPLPITDIEKLQFKIVYDKQPEFNIPFYSGVIVIRFAIEKLTYITQQNQISKSVQLNESEMTDYEKKLRTIVDDKISILKEFNKTYFN